MLNPLYELIAKIIVAIHAGLAPIFGMGSGWSWGLSIVLLTVLMRLALFPLFVRQIRSQRAMQLLAPKLKELQVKYKGDRERFAQEQMKLYKESGANPLLGCLPLLLQMPVFFALFHVLNGIKPDAVTGKYSAHSGMSAQLVESAAHAKILGAPIAASFRSSQSALDAFNASPGVVRSVAAVMILLMGASTFWTQRQMLARTGGEMPAFQKRLLYILPVSFLFFGLNFQIGVLLYWLTTNVWSMGQQHFVIAKMGAYGPAPAKEDKAKPKPASGPALPPQPRLAGEGSAASPERPKPPPPERRPPTGRARRKGRGGRGGRR